MALPFIPFQEIPAVFQTLAVEAATEPLQELVGYISTNWITSTIFPPKDWSVYGEAVRTNNDVEGWHNALNRRASGRPRLPLYQLIELLHMEAKLVQLQMRLVADKKLARIQRKRYRGYQQDIRSLGRIFQPRKDCTAASKRLFISKRSCKTKSEK